MFNVFKAAFWTVVILLTLAVVATLSVGFAQWAHS